MSQEKLDKYTFFEVENGIYQHQIGKPFPTGVLVFTTIGLVVVSIFRSSIWAVILFILLFKATLFNLIVFFINQSSYFDANEKVFIVNLHRWKKKKRLIYPFNSFDKFDIEEVKMIRGFKINVYIEFKTDNELNRFLLFENIKRKDIDTLISETKKILDK